MALPVQSNSTAALAWIPKAGCNSNSNTTNFLLPKTTPTRAPRSFSFFITQTSLSSLKPSRAHSNAKVLDGSSTRHNTLLVETFHENQSPGDLLEKLRKQNACPLRILSDDGDWTKEQFWAAVRFLIHASRSHEILQVFDMWKNIEKSRIDEFFYEKIIRLLSEEGMIEEAVTAFLEMKTHGLRPSLGTYNSIIHCFAEKGNFDDALSYLDEMKKANLAPESDTYDGLIQAYGRYKMYDEMAICIKKMQLEGCSPDHITYNLLIREFAQAGLLKRMERIYQKMISKKMDFQSSTLVAMLEAYARFGIVEKMEGVYRRVLNSKIPLKDGLIRQLAGVYIGNYMFTRLDNLGLDVSSTVGTTGLVWCLRLLSHACLLSRKGMGSIVREMEEANVSWDATVANIIMLALLKIKDFKRLEALLSQLPTRHVEPDIVTVGILFDAITIGFDGSGFLDTWRKMGYLHCAVEMNTDPLVLTAFGKGHFLRACEEAYCSLEPQAREKGPWTYNDLIDFVLNYKGKEV